MKVLALDFDGVISDSAAESFAVALRTYVMLRPETKLREVAREIVEGPPAALRAHPIFQDFLDLMPLGNRAEDFGVALDIIESGGGVEDQVAYDARYLAWSNEERQMFHRRFYEERVRLADTDRKSWLALLAPYPPVVELLRRRAGDVELALATAKDHRSVVILLEAYGLTPLFAEDHILDKEAGPSKRAHLDALSRRLCTEFADITFVDDKVNHLEAVSGLGVRCALAAWGYNGPREHEAARTQGFLVCDLADVERTLFGDG